MNRSAGSHARRAFSLGSALLLTLTVSTGSLAQDASPAPTPTSVSPPAEAPAPTGLTLGPWRSATVEEFPGATIVGSLVSSERGTVALGSQPFDRAAGPAFWFSEDATAFERGTVAKNARVGGIEAGAAGPDGWVAVGRSFPERAHAWTSQNGRHWKKATVESAKGHVLYDVAYTPIGFVAVGCEAEFHCRKGKAWVSKDGRAWKVLSRLPIQLPYAVTTVGDRIVVAGFSNGFETNFSNAVTASSANGKKWRLDDLLGPDGSGFNSLASREGEAFASGFKQGEFAPDDFAVLSRTGNGRAWSPIEPEVFHGWSGTGVAASYDLVLVVGQGNFDDFIAPVSYSSADLETWSPGTFVDGLRAEIYGISGATFTQDGDHALMAGYIDYVPAIWIADVAAVGSPEAEPAPVGPLGPVAPERFAVAVTPDGFDGAVVSDVIAGGPGYIAVGGGSDGNASSPLAWTSLDGTSWEAASFATGATAGGIESVTALADGTYAAVGNDATAGEALAWVSADGSTWELASAHESFATSVLHDVTATVEGVTAVGAAAAPDGSEGRVWSSPDGRTWETPAELPLSPLTIGSRGVTLATGGADGAGGDDGSKAVIALRDADGWAPTGALGDPASSIVDLATSSDGYVAAGWQQRPGKKVESALFISPDGITWSPVTHKRLQGMTATGVGLNEDGFLLVGTKNGEPLGFWSRDLEGFETIRFPKETVRDGLVIDGGTITADGTMAFAFGNEAGRPAIWYSVVE